MEARLLILCGDKRQRWTGETKRKNGVGGLALPSGEKAGPKGVERQRMLFNISILQDIDLEEKAAGRLGSCLYSIAIRAD